MTEGELKRGIVVMMHDMLHVMKSLGGHPAYISWANFMMDYPDWRDKLRSTLTKCKECGALSWDRDCGAYVHIVKDVQSEFVLTLKVS